LIFEEIVANQNIKNSNKEENKNITQRNQQNEYNYNFLSKIFHLLVRILRRAIILDFNFEATWTTLFKRTQ